MSSTRNILGKISAKAGTYAGAMVTGSALYAASASAGSALAAYIFMPEQLTNFARMNAAGSAIVGAVAGAMPVLASDFSNSYDIECPTSVILSLSLFGVKATVIPLVIGYALLSDANSLTLASYLGIYYFSLLADLPLTGLVSVGSSCLLPEINHKIKKSLDNIEEGKVSRPRMPNHGSWSTD